MTQSVPSSCSYCLNSIASGEAEIEAHLATHSELYKVNRMVDALRVISTVSNVLVDYQRTLHQIIAGEIDSTEALTRMHERITGMINNDIMPYMQNTSYDG